MNHLNKCHFRYNTLLQITPFRVKQKQEQYNIHVHTTSYVELFQQIKR
jgi:hypothetical protein